MVETIKMKPFDLFVPITRVDEDERVVEGYCYVNADVGDGWNLKRAALEKAAAAYMQFPALREMHDRKAAGSAVAVSFDDRGCYLRARVVDDDAWRKVKERVYRGFSVGGKPKIARGREIEEFEWVETSLVDRPADREAVFTLYRTGELPDEVEVRRLPETVQLPLDFGNDAGLERDRGGGAAGSLGSVGSLGSEGSPGSGGYNQSEGQTEASVGSPGSGGRDPAGSAAGRGDWVRRSELDAAVSRAQELEKDRGELLERAQRLAEEADRERQERRRAEERYESLLRSPLPAVKPPVRFAGALREFLANREAEGEAADVARLRAELREIGAKPAATQAERDRQIARVMEIKQSLREVGATAS